MENIVKLSPVCGGGPGNDCEPQEACVVTFEEPTLSDLSESVTKWFTERPDYLPISVSHGFQTEWERGSGFGNPQPVPSHSALLLACYATARARERVSDQPGRRIHDGGRSPDPEDCEAELATLVCGRGDAADCEGGRLCTVFFEAQNLGLLGKGVTGWMMRYSHYRPVSLSHAVETRWKRGPMANPQPIPAYTGVLLVSIGEQAA